MEWNGMESNKTKWNNAKNITVLINSWERIGRKGHQVLLQTFLRFTQQNLEICLLLYFGQTKPVSPFMVTVFESQSPRTWSFSFSHLEFILLHWLAITGQCPDHPATLRQCYLTFAVPASTEVGTFSCCLVTVKLPCQDANTIFSLEELAV